MKVKDDWMINEKEEEERNELFEEMYSHSKAGEFETIEQLQSDLEDVRRELAVWQGIANKDRSRADGYKEQMQKAERNNAIGWFKY